MFVLDNLVQDGVGKVIRLTITRTHDNAPVATVIRWTRLKGHQPFTLVLHDQDMAIPA